MDETYTYEAYNVRTRQWSGVIKVMTAEQAHWRNAHLRAYGFPGRWFRRPAQTQCQQAQPERKSA